MSNPDHPEKPAFEITDEMVAAGLAALKKWEREEPEPWLGTLVKSVYLAMKNAEEPDR